MNNKKNIFTILLLAFICTATAQNSYNFLPKWTVGDKKTISIAQRETEYKREKLTEDTTTYLSAALTVTQEDNDNYFLTILYQNVAMTSAINFYDKLNEELKDYKNLTLKYKVSKQTGKAELINWKETQQFINQSFEQIDALLEKKVPDVSAFTKYAFDPIKELFESKENIESYMAGEIGFLFFPYNKQFKAGDTLHIVERCANPLNPADTVDQTTLVYLSNIDDAKKRCTINANDILDMTSFKEMMKSVMSKMGNSFGIADSSKNKAAKEIDNIDFSFTNTTKIDYDYGTTWPTEVIKTTLILGTEPRGKNEKKVVTSIRIK